MRWRSAAQVLAGIVALAVPMVSVGAGGRVPAPPPPRVVLVSLDGGADWLIDGWMAEGKAPAFSRLAAEGAAADAMISTWPSLTAGAHATLWTGAPPRVHGIHGNQSPLVPPSEHTVLEQQSGYLSSTLRAEPIWITAARAGRKALVLQASQSAPFTGAFPGRLLQFDVFATELARWALVEGNASSQPHLFRIGDEPASIVAAAGDSLRLIVGDQRAEIAAAPGRRWSPTLRVRIGAREGFFRAGLVSYDRASGAFALLRGRVSEIVSSRPAERDRFVRAAGTIMDGGLIPLYAQGRFGRTIVEGGSGEAEAVFVEAIGLNQEYWDGAIEYAAGQPWQLLVAYNPTLDFVQHAWFGLVDPESSVYRPELAERIRPYLEQLFARCTDQYVARLRQRFPDAAIVIASDHGTEGAGRTLYPNTILAQAGLLTLTPTGQVDLSRSKAVYLWGRGGIITLNGTAWKSGIVLGEERDAVARAVTDALLAARDPDTGGHVVRAVFDAARDGEAFGFGGPGVDLIFDPAPDYAPSAALGRTAIAESSGPLGEGEHGASPYRRKLHGIFYAVGPGVGRGVRLPMVRAVDVAPTVAALLGIPAPANSVGQVLVLDPLRHVGRD